MNKCFLRWASAFGALSVALGAFAAHGLKPILNEYQKGIFETGVKYMFFHALALMFVGILMEKFPSKLMNWAGKLFIIGIFIFSGSVMLLSYLQATQGEKFNWLGAITPIGGLAFIAGWISLLIAVGKK